MGSNDKPRSRQPKAKATVKNARPSKKTPSPRPRNKRGAASKQGALIKRALNRVQERLKKAELTPTIGDFIRLLQLQKDMGFDQPRQVKVQWVATEKPELKTEE